MFGFVKDNLKCSRYGFCLGCKCCANYWEKMPIMIVLVVVVITIFIMSARKVQEFKYLCKIMNIVVGNDGSHETHVNVTIYWIFKSVGSMFTSFNIYIIILISFMFLMKPYLNIKMYFIYDV